MSRRGRLGLAVALLAAVALLIVISTRPTSPEARQAAADALVAGIGAGVTVDSSSLLATRAIADFGVGAEVRLVLIRIVDEVRVEVRLESPRDVSFEGPLQACLVGPDAAPDDAGLEDRCWGEEALGPLIEAQLSTDEHGRLRLEPGTPVTVRATVHRGDVRCDYPPGLWHLEVLVNPVVDGSPAGARYVPHPTFEVPFLPGQELTLVQERRYCGLASKVFREQGEPVIAGG